MRPSLKPRYSHFWISNRKVMAITKENKVVRGLDISRIGAVIKAALAKKGNAKIFFGTCDTAATTNPKIVDCPAFTQDDLVTGAIIIVVFANTSSGAATNLKLNVNDSGAFAIKAFQGAAVSTVGYNNYLLAGVPIIFGFNGSAWVILGYASNTNTTYSAMTQAQADAGTSTTGYRISPAVLKATVEKLLSANQADWGETDTESPSYILNKPDIGTKVITSQPSGGMLPNVMYNLGTLAGDTAFTLATPTDSSILNHYFWTFETGSTAPAITWPADIIEWDTGSAPTISANKHYEVSALNGVAVVMEV